MDLLEQFIRDFIVKKGIASHFSDRTAREILDLIDTKEFAALHARRINTLTDFGLGEQLNLKWRIAMSALTDAMAVALTALQTKLADTAATTDQITAQIHAVVDPAVAALNDTVARIASSEKTDAENVADLTAAITEFTAAFAPASSGGADTGTVGTDAEGTGASEPTPTASTLLAAAAATASPDADVPPADASAGASA